MHQLKRLLSKLKLKNSKGKELNATNKKLFNEFIDNFCSAKNRTILYRGTESIPEYNTDVRDTQKFAYNLFKLGEKSHYFSQNPYTRFDINDCSNIVFEYIFECLNEKLCKNKDFEGFLDNNKSINYFSSICKKTEFTTIINDIKPIEKKEYVKDYYFSLLHILDISIDGNRDYMISTSKDIEVANYFKNGGIIIVSWIPIKERNRQIIKYSNVNKSDYIIRDLGLPYYDISPYSDEKEICVKCGLLPRYIIGYSIDNSFIVNPDLLLKIRFPYSMKSFINFGIDNIYQYDFDDVIKKTSYNEGYIHSNGHYCNLPYKKNQ